EHLVVAVGLVAGGVGDLVAVAGVVDEDEVARPRRLREAVERGEHPVARGLAVVERLDLEALPAEGRDDEGVGVVDGAGEAGGGEGAGDGRPRGGREGRDARHKGNCGGAGRRGAGARTSRGLNGPSSTSV